MKLSNNYLFHLGWLVWVSLVVACSAQEGETNDYSSPSDSSSFSKHQRVWARYSSMNGYEALATCASHILHETHDTDWIVFEMPTSTSTDNICSFANLRRISGVEEIEHDTPVQALAPMTGFLSSSSNNNTTYYRHEDMVTENYGWDMIQANQLLLLEESSSYNLTQKWDPIICVVDSGVDTNHPGLQKSHITGTHVQRFWSNEKWEWNYDPIGHGTQIVGLLASRKNTTSFGPFRVHVVRALDDHGIGYESDIRMAAEKCVAKGASIINFSLGGPYSSYYSDYFYKNLVATKNVLLIGAAGNSGNKQQTYPASYPSVISVGAVDESSRVWSCSNQNNQVELVAPGVGIISTSLAEAKKVSFHLHFDKSTYDTHTISRHVPTSYESTNAVFGVVVDCRQSWEKCARRIKRKSRRSKFEGKSFLCWWEDTSTSDSLDDAVKRCHGSGASGIIVVSTADFHEKETPNIWFSFFPENFLGLALSVNDGIELIQRNVLNKEVAIQAFTKGDMEVVHTYKSETGTSIASPHVAAAAALLWSLQEKDECSNEQIRFALAITAKNDIWKCSQNKGYGLLQVRDAYEWLVKNPCGSWSVQQPSKGGCTTV